MSLFFALVLGLQSYGDRITFTVPHHLTKLQRSGLKSDRILAMGFDEWSDYCRDHRLPDSGITAGVDGDRVVWGYCLRVRNNRRLAKLPKTRKAIISNWRKHLLDEQLAAIRLTDFLQSGGTYAIHAVKNAFISSEQATYAQILGMKPIRYPERTLKQIADGYRKDHNRFSDTALRELKITERLGVRLGPRAESIVQLVASDPTSCQTENGDVIFPYARIGL